MAKIVVAKAIHNNNPNTLTPHTPSREIVPVVNPTSEGRVLKKIV